MPTIREVLDQANIPVVLHRGRGKPLAVRLPYAANNREWLRNDRRAMPTWRKDKRWWLVPLAWFSDTIERAVHHYGRAYVIQTYRPQQQCAPACWNARGFDCECSCMGENHGTGHPAGRWYVVSDTFATSWGDRQFTCRLITAKPPAS